MNYTYKSYMTVTDILKETKDRKHIYVAKCFLAINKTGSYIVHLYPEDEKFMEDKHNELVPDNITIQELAEILKVTPEDLEKHIKLFTTKKMYKDRVFDLKGLKKSIQTKGAKKALQQRRDANKEDLLKYFGTEEKYKAFMQHTLFASFKIKISLNQLYEYDDSNKVFDYVTVELPVYPVDNKTWISNPEHKKDLFRYAMIRLSHHPDYEKYKIPVSRLKLYNVSWDCEFITFTLVMKD